MNLIEKADQLMVAYQWGDEQSLEKLYKLFQRPLYSFIYRYSQDEQLSIDIVQDTFVQLQRYKNNFDPEKGKLKSYLFQTAYRIMINKLNRRKRWRERLPFLVPDESKNTDISERITVRQAVADLPHIQRAVILLYYYHDLPQKEIAHILDIPLGTVKSRLHTAVRKLKKDLGVDHNVNGTSKG